MPVSGFERTVAYRELARGHDCLLQRPVTLYSLRQKFFSFVVLENISFDYHETRGSPYLSLNEQNCWLITCQTISSEDIFEAVNLFKGSENRFYKFAQ